MSYLARNHDSYVLDEVLEMEAPALPEAPPCPLEFARTILNFQPDPKQAAVLASRANEGIVNCSRQWGKSTLMAILALHKALSQPHGLILFLAQGKRQSRELLAKVEVFLDQLAIKRKGNAETDKGIFLPNRSRFIALPCAGHKLRGYSAASMIVIDEAAQVPDAVYNIVRPMRMVSRGDVWLSSTPFGRRGFFYEEWISQEPMARFAVPASECPRLDADLLAREKRRMTDAYYRQEFQCEFVDPDDALFPLHLLNRAIADDEWLVSL